VLLTFGALRPVTTVPASESATGGDGRVDERDLVAELDRGTADARETARWRC